MTHLPAFQLALSILAAVPAAAATTPPAAVASEHGDDEHARLFAEDRFPSASACRTCHPGQYAQWSASQHAYAQVSPIFNAMQGTITRLTNGTNGDFCIRCHTPQGMAMGEHTAGTNVGRHDVSNEGVTCIVCHRMNANFGKFSARAPLSEGPLTAKVNGPTGNAELKRVLASDDYRVKTSDDPGPGRPIHSDADRFFHLVEPGFCGTCHDVTLPDGFRLEEAFSEYKVSPAARAGTTCQDCHMGEVPGDPAGGRAFGPAAIVGGVPTRDRSLSNHMITGPDYSVVHPVIFPVEPKAFEIASLSEWLLFPEDSDWGRPVFEAGAAAAASFPPPWDSPDLRAEARELLDAQVALRQEGFDRGTELLRRGYLLGEPKVLEASRGSLRFEVPVANGVPTHNVPTGFTAERVVFLRVTVTDADGRVAFVSGDLDANGDLRDRHSVLVRAGEAPRDPQLFSLQSRFMTRNLRGSEREQVLAVNHSIDALPFVRPETTPSILAGRPRGARIHKMGIPPGEQRLARYDVPRSALDGPGPHEVHVQLVAGMVPVNLIHAVQDQGFDYGLTARELADAVVAGHRVLHERRFTVEAGAPRDAVVAAR